MGYCEKCNVENWGRYCSYCGRDTQEKEKKNIKPVIVTVAVVALVVALIVFLWIVFSNIFTVSRVSKIELGMNQEEVVKILGEPTTKADGVYQWYESKAAKTYEKIEKAENSLFSDDDMEDFDEFEESFDEMEKLYDELEGMTYKAIIVRFSDNKVSEVFLDMEHKYDLLSDGNSNGEKQVDEITLGIEGIDIKKVDSVFGIATDLKNVKYSATFTDGSYILRRGYFSGQFEGLEQKYVTLEWQDSVAKYSKVSEIITLATINGGTLESWEIIGSKDKAKEIMIPDEVTTINNDVFKDWSNLTNVTIGSGLTSISGVFSDCSSLKYIQVTAGNETFSSQDGILYNKDKTKMVFVPNAMEGTITIPDSVTSISGGAFSGTGYYKDIENWENDVLYIGDWLITAKTTISGEYTIKDGTKGIANSAFV